MGLSVKPRVGDLVKIGKETGHVLSDEASPRGHVIVKMHDGRTLSIDWTLLLPGEDAAPQAALAPSL